MDDFFAELDAEIAKHAQKKQIRVDAEKAKKIAMNRANDEVKRLVALREYRELQALIDVDYWRTTGYVALFSEQVCDGCGSVHQMFLQYMEQQVSRTRATDKRLVRVDIPGFPRTVVVKTHKTHLCADCCDEHGFLIDDALVGVEHQPIVVSPTYIQGDINAPSESDRTADPDVRLSA